MSRATRRPVDILTWVERKRTATVTSSCLQRQEVVGITLFWTSFFFFLPPGDAWTNTTTTSVLTEQYSRQERTAYCPHLPTRLGKWNQHARLKAQAAEQERLGFRNAVSCGVCPRGERMLTQRDFFKSQLQEYREDGAQRYCTMFPENNYCSWSSLFLGRSRCAFVWRPTETAPLLSIKPPKTDTGCGLKWLWVQIKFSNTAYLYSVWVHSIQSCFYLTQFNTFSLLAHTHSPLKGLHSQSMKVELTHLRWWWPTHTLHIERFVFKVMVTHKWRSWKEILCLWYHVTKTTLTDQHSFFFLTYWERRKFTHLSSQYVVCQPLLLLSFFPFGFRLLDYISQHIS